jgi:Domain of unknown function (DUF6371)
MGVKLESYNGHKSRYRCPQCGRNGMFTRYIDENGHYLADDVGRCNREINCGYHKSPKDYFKDTPYNGERRQFKPRFTEPQRTVQYIPLELMTKSLSGYEQNYFFHFLCNLIGEENAINRMAHYNIGTSKHWLGTSVFWQVDINGRVRQLKLMLYNPKTGKRLKSDDFAMKWDYKTQTYSVDIGSQDKSLIYGKYIQGRRFKDCNFQQCFFGEHLLRDTGRIAIVESEKTAVIASHYYPQFIWIATGGSNGAGFTKPNVCKVLHGREVVMFPDIGQFENWTRKSKELQRIISCKIIVSELLEHYVDQFEQKEGYDLADFLIANNSPQFDKKLPEFYPERDFYEKTILTDLNKWVPLEGFEGF